MFCSPECKAIKASPAKIPKDAPPPPPPKCPRPDKRGFGTEVECRAHFSTLLVTDPTLGVYLCRCRRWHAGHFAVDSALQIRNRARIRRLDTTADGAPLSEA